MFESEHEIQQRKTARLKELVAGKTFIVMDNDHVRCDIARKLEALGAEQVLTAEDATQVKKELAVLSRHNVRVDMIVTDIQVDPGHEGGTSLIEFLRKFDFVDNTIRYRADDTAYTTDDAGNKVPYGKKLPILVHSGGAEGRQYIDNKTVFFAARGHENIMEAIGRTLEKLLELNPPAPPEPTTAQTPEKPAESPPAQTEDAPKGQQTFNAPPQRISPKEYYSLLNPNPVSKRDLFHNARKRQLEDFKRNDDDDKPGFPNH